jgi:hypothetical protein
MAAFTLVLVVANIIISLWVIWIKKVQLNGIIRDSLIKIYKLEKIILYNIIYKLLYFLWLQ